MSLNPRTQLLLPAVVATFLLLAGCTASTPTPSTPTATSKPRTINGYAIVQESPVTAADSDKRANRYMTGDFSCVAKKGFEDITSNALVQLLDSKGDVVARGALGVGSSDSKILNPTMGDPCIFEFTLTNVSIDQAEYKIHVGKLDRPPLTFSADDLKRGPLVFVDGKQ